MAYTVTGMTEPPDVGFSCGSRHTAQGARDLATAFLASGMREIEIRDSNGNLCSTRGLAAATDDDETQAAAARLAAL